MSAIALYEIANARDILDNWLAESEGELTPELETLLAELDGKADDKIEKVALYIRERLAHAAAVKEEVARLAAIQKREERAADSLKRYLHDQMIRMGKDKVNGLLCVVALQKNPPSVVGEVPVETLGLWRETLTDGFGRFVRFVPATYALDRKAILDAHKAGDAIPADLTITQSLSLRIR